MTVLVAFIFEFIFGALFGYVITRYPRIRIVLYVLALITLLLLICTSGEGLNVLVPNNWYSFGIGFVGLLLGINLGEWYAKKRMNRLPTV